MPQSTNYFCQNISNFIALHYNYLGKIIETDYRFISINFIILWSLQIFIFQIMNSKLFNAYCFYYLFILPNSKFFNLSNIILPDKYYFMVLAFILYITHLYFPRSFIRINQNYIIFNFINFRKIIKDPRANFTYLKSNSSFLYFGYSILYFFIYFRYILLDLIAFFQFFLLIFKSQKQIMADLGSRILKPKSFLC